MGVGSITDSTCGISVFIQIENAEVLNFLILDHVCREKYRQKLRKE